MQNFDFHFNEFLKIADKVWDYGNGLVTFKMGKKFIKVIKDSSVNCFIDLSNGDVLKPASWSRPAPHARGNIFNADNGRGALERYGVVYLK